jgi:hypothetical protein
VPPSPNSCFKIRRRSVSSAAPHIAFQQAEGARRAFQRGYLQTRLQPEDLMVKKLNCSFGVFSTLIRRGTKYQTTHRQAKLDSRNLTNITTGVTHRQLNFAASHKKELTASGSAKRGRLAPAGAAQSLAKCLNLLKRYRASTLLEFSRVKFFVTKLSSTRCARSPADRGARRMNGSVLLDCSCGFCFSVSKL